MYCDVAVTLLRSSVFPPSQGAHVHLIPGLAFLRVRQEIVEISRRPRL